MSEIETEMMWWGLHGEYETLALLTQTGSQVSCSQLPRVIVRLDNVDFEQRKKICSLDAWPRWKGWCFLKAGGPPLDSPG